ncbi:hypothetical protein RSAG8_05020, partial [Rhizoctonia solani AG-8 WAC10335]
MNQITSNSILAQVKKSSTSQTSLNATPKVVGTPSGTQSDLQTELRRSDRSRSRSTRAKEGGYDEMLAANKQCSARAKHTRSLSNKAKSSHTHSDAESLDSRHMSAALETDNDDVRPDTPTRSLSPCNKE